MTENKKPSVLKCVRGDELVMCTMGLYWLLDGPSLLNEESVNDKFSQTHNSVTHPLQIAQHPNHKTYPTA